MRSLTPFDVMYGCNPDGAWTNWRHMSLKGKRDGFDREDIRYPVLADEAKRHQWLDLS